MTVGDSGIGKTCLLTVFGQDRFPDENDVIPTISDIVNHTVSFEEKGAEDVVLNIWDTAG